MVGEVPGAIKAYHCYSDAPSKVCGPCAVKLCLVEQARKALLSIGALENLLYVLMQDSG